MARLNHVKSFRGTTKTPDGNLTCSRCGDKIKKGDPYRWWANRAPGSRGGFKRVRCMKSECAPTTAEMTPGRRGQWYGLQEGFEQELAACTSVEDVRGAAESIAAEIEAFGEEFTEGADNMEEGFGHPTYQSDELREKGEAIIEIAQDLQSLDFEEAEEEEFDEDAAREEVRTEMQASGEDPDEDEPSFISRLQAKRDEWDEEHVDGEDDEEAVEAARQLVQEKLDEVDV